MSEPAGDAARLIDRVLPRPDFKATHARRIDADPARVFSAVRELDLRGVPSIRILFALRGISSRRLTLDGAFDMGFALLAEDPGREMVLGLIGRPWTLRGGVRRFAAEEFSEWSEPGFAKVAWNFEVHPMGSGACVTTETRIVCTDRVSSRRFARYWRVARPFSALVRRRMLAVIARRTESPEKGREQTDG